MVMICYSKRYRLKSTKEKAHEAKSRRNKAQAFRYPLSVELYRVHSVLPATVCDDKCTVLPTRETHLSLEFRFLFYFIGGQSHRHAAPGY